MRTRTRTALLVLAALLAVGGATALALRGGSGGGTSTATSSAAGSASAFEGAPLPSPVHAPDFTLLDQNGRRTTLSEYRGHVVVLAFLDSTCTPGCELVAQQVRGALDDLGRPVPVLFVSADPRADTPANVRAFLAGASLSGRVRYLAAPRAALPAVWRAYSVTTPSTGRRAFEAALTVLLVDPAGRQRVLFQQEQLTPEGLAHDIGRLQSG
jgi:protein SCO1/2